MGNIKDKTCCRTGCRDEGEIENDVGITVDKRGLKNIILIQAHIRRFFIMNIYNNYKNDKKSKIKTQAIQITQTNEIQASKSKPTNYQTPNENRSSFDISKIPGQLVESENENHIPICFINKKVLEIEKSLGRFTLTDKEEYDLSLKDLRKYTIKYTDDTLYSGYLNKNWQREGYGVFFMADGSKYEGFFFSDKMNGRGRLINSLGFYYEGEFQNNNAEGFGKYVTGEGAIYLGQWKEDKQNGHGEELFPDGSRYEGEFFNGKKHRKGLFSFQDNSKFEGNFENNLIHGIGTYNWIDGKVYQGEWAENQMNGKGIFVWPDKKKYIGQYKNDKKHGYGIFIWPEGKKYEGMWADGKQHGYGIFSSNKHSKMGVWNSGRKVKWINESEKEYKEIKEFLNKYQEEAKLNKLTEFVD